jgi:hypothetical protein
MPQGLGDPLTVLSFSAMPIEELCDHHRNLLAAQREADHWHRLIGARIDLAVASVADLDEPIAPPNTFTAGTGCAPPEHLRELIGVVVAGDLRLHETSLLMTLRDAQAKLADYTRTLRELSDEAARVIASRVGAVRVTALT